MGGRGAKGTRDGGQARAVRACVKWGEAVLGRSPCRGRVRLERKGLRGDASDAAACVMGVMLGAGGCTSRVGLCGVKTGAETPCHAQEVSMASLRAG